MTFSATIKTELCSHNTAKSCCRKAECYGALLFSKSFCRDNITVLTEHPKFGQHITELIAEECGVFVDREVKITHRSKLPETCTVNVPGEDQCAQVIEHFNHTENSINGKIVSKHCCRESFLRGVFLACGSVINPETEYHLELAVPTKELAEELCNIMISERWLEVHPSILPRKGSHIVYLKGADAIADFLTFIGASNGALEVIQIKMLKELRNDVNRRSNCETANLTKTANAAAVQRIAIEKIMHYKGLDSLSPELKELAELRYENPEMSLRELGENLTRPISRSGVNHRIQKLLEMAEEYPDIT